MLVSGTGSILQAVIDACADPGYGARVVAVGADRDGALGLRRAEAAGIPTFARKLGDSPDRAAWDEALTADCAAYEPDLILLAGFLKLVGPRFLATFGGRIINTHQALLPSYPGMHGVRDALEHGAKVTGCTIFLVDAGVDTGPILAQAAVPVLDDDDEPTLLERVKVAERALVVDTAGRMLRDGWTVDGRRARLGGGKSGAPGNAGGQQQ